MSVLLRNGTDRRWRRPAAVDFASEGELETLLKESPEVIPGISPPVAVATQLHVQGSGRLDILLVDSDGELTLVECKLRVNPDIRRTVIGQAFAYASGVMQWTYDDLDAAWLAKNQRSLADEFKGSSEWAEDRFRLNVTNNLRAGQVRIVIAVDEMTPELTRTVTYINEHSSGAYRLFGLELKRLSDGDVEVLMPVLHGQESAESVGKTDSSGLSLEEKIAAAGPEVGEVTRLLTEWGETNRLEIKRTDSVVRVRDGLGTVAAVFPHYGTMDFWTKRFTSEQQDKLLPILSDIASTVGGRQVGRQSWTVPCSSIVKSWDSVTGILDRLLSIRSEIQGEP